MYDWNRIYELTVLCYCICLDLISAFAYGYLVRAFTGKRRIAWSVGVIYMLPMIPSYFNPTESSLLPVSGVSILLGFLFLCLTDRRRYLQKVFLAVTFFSVRWFAFGVESCIGVVLGRLCVYYPGYWEDMRTEYGLFLITSVIEIILGAVLLLGAIAWITKAYWYKQEELRLSEWGLMVMPSVAGLMAYVVYKYMDSLYEAAGYSTYEAPISYQWCNVLFYVTMYVSVVGVIVFFQKIKTGEQEEKEKALLAEQMGDMKRHIRQVEELYQEIRSIKHDMGNHIQVLERLCGEDAAQAGNTAQVNTRPGSKTGQTAGSGIQTGVQAYVCAMKEQYSAACEEIRTGNPVTDVIIEEKMREAENRGITMCCEFQYPKEYAVDVFDLSIILHNGLENAIEAVQICREDRGEAGDWSDIHIWSSFQGNMYTIFISNPYANKITIDTEKDLLYTTKTDGEGHGYGLRNIRKVAGKYDGEVEFWTEDGIFTLAVLLKLQA